MRITELPQAASVAQTDDLAIDVPGGRTYRIPRSILAPAPYIATIPTGQWSGSGSDYYITVTASNVTADAMLYPFYDNASAALLNGPVWVIPADGSFTIHTSAIPSGTVTISVLLAGIVGEAQYQVLADVYSTSQVDAKIAQSTAWVRIADIATAANTAYDNTVSVSYPSDCKEIMVTLQRDSNRRTFASTVLPFAQFNNGAAYAGGSYMLYSGLMSNNDTGIYVNAVVIYTSATNIEIALSANSESIRVRVYAR